MNIVYLKEKRDECLSKLERGTSRIYLQEFLHVYDTTKKQNKKPRELLKEFQYAVREIRDWTVDKIKEQHFLFTRQCDVFDNLVRSIFKLHLAIYNSMNESNFDAAIPNPGQYLHETYLSIARRLWKEPYLLYDVKVDKMTYQKNIIRLEKIIRKCLRETFVFMLPFKEFDEQLGNEEEEDEEDVDDDYEIVPEVPDEDDEDLEEEEEDAEQEEEECEQEEDPEEEEEAEQEEEYAKQEEEYAEQEEEAEESEEAHEAEPMIDTEDACREQPDQKVEFEQPAPQQQLAQEEQTEEDDESEAESPPQQADVEMEQQQQQQEQQEQHDPNIRIIQLPVRRTLAERKRLVKEKVKQRGFPEFSQQPRPTDSFF